MGWWQIDGGFVYVEANELDGLDVVILRTLAVLSHHWTGVNTWSLSDFGVILHGKLTSRHG